RAELGVVCALPIAIKPGVAVPFLQKSPHRYRDCHPSGRRDESQFGLSDAAWGICFPLGKENSRSPAPRPESRLLEWRCGGARDERARKNDAFRGTTFRTKLTREE